MHYQHAQKTMDKALARLARELKTPLGTMHQDGELKAEYLGAAPVTCAKCARTRSPDPSLPL